MKTRLGILILALALVGCTKSDDYLRSLLAKKTEGEQLVDPYLAIFRNLRYASDLPLRKELWCGEINSKNRMGGYTDWEEFSLSILNDGSIYLTIRKNIPSAASISGMPADLKEHLMGAEKFLKELATSECEPTKPAPDYLYFKK